MIKPQQPQQYKENKKQECKMGSVRRLYFLVQSASRLAFFDHPQVASAINPSIQGWALLATSTRVQAQC